MGKFAETFVLWSEALGDAKLEYEPYLAETYREAFTNGDRADRSWVFSFITFRADRDQSGFDIVVDALAHDDENTAMDACATCLYLAIDGHQLGIDAPAKLAAFADGREQEWLDIVADTISSLEDTSARPAPVSFSDFYYRWRHAVGETFARYSDILKSGYRAGWADGDATERLAVLDFIAETREVAGYDIILAGLEDEDEGVRTRANEYVAVAVADMRERHPDLDELIARQQDQQGDQETSSEES